MWNELTEAGESDEQNPHSHSRCREKAASGLSALMVEKSVTAFQDSASKYQDGFLVPGSQRFTECLPCARHCTKQLAYTVSSDPHSSLQRWMLCYLTLLKNWDLAKGRNLHKFVKLLSGKALTDAVFDNWTALHYKEGKKCKDPQEHRQEGPGSDREWRETPRRKRGGHEIELMKSWLDIAGQCVGIKSRGPGA